MRRLFEQLRVQQRTAFCARGRNRRETFMAELSWTPSTPSASPWQHNTANGRVSWPFVANSVNSQQTQARNETCEKLVSFRSVTKKHLPTGSSVRAHAVHPYSDASTGITSPSFPSSEASFPHSISEENSETLAVTQTVCDGNPEANGFLGASSGCQQHPSGALRPDGAYGRLLLGPQEQLPPRVEHVLVERTGPAVEVLAAALNLPARCCCTHTLMPGVLGHRNAP